MSVALFLASRLLRRRGTALLRTSAAAAFAAIALGVAALLVALALMTGYRDALRDGILGAGGHVVVMPPPDLTTAEIEDLDRRLARIGDVESVSRALYLPGLLRGRDGAGTEVVTVKAAEVAPAFVALPEGVASGPLPVAIGAGVARRSGVEPGSLLSIQVAAGRSLRSIPAVVEQVFHTGFVEVDERWVVARLDALGRRLGAVGEPMIELRLHDPDNADVVRRTVEAEAGRLAVATTWQDSNRVLFAALQWQKLSLGVVLSLVLGVGAFEVASALVVLITEKRRTLGVLLALGGRPRLVRRTFVLAGAGLGGAGVIGGVVLGLAVVGVLTALGLPRFSPEIASIYMVDRMPLHVGLGDLVIVFLLGLLEVIVAATIPARRASRRDPVEVLRWV